MIGAVGAVLLAAAMLVTSRPAQAAAVVIEPNTFADVVANDGRCSLREAITAANLDARSGSRAGECRAGRNSRPDVVKLGAGTYRMTIDVAGTESANAEGDFDLSTPMKLVGRGPGKTTINGRRVDRVLDIGVNAVTVQALTVTRGRTPDGAGGTAGGPGAASEAGGGIRTGSSATSTILDVAITENATGDGGFGSTGSTGTGGAGGSAGAGGGLQNLGRLRIVSSIVRTNTAGDGGNGAPSSTAVGRGGHGGSGGGIANAGDLTIIKSTIDSNTTGDGGDAASSPTLTVSGGAGGAGGGIFNNGPAAELTIDASTIAKNATGVRGASSSPTTPSTFVDGQGGGINNPSDAALNATNTTIAGNRAKGWGGGVLNGGNATFNNVTVTYNRANEAGMGARGGGISAEGSGTFNIANSVIARNAVAPGGTTGGPQCNGTFASQGYNVVEDTTSCPGFTATGDQVVTPDVGALANNGGPTRTIALLPGSPGINDGNPNTPTGAGGRCEPFDQRGAPRDPCDSGAYDLVRCGTTIANRIGGEGEDLLIGTDGKDGILAFDGNDILRGLDGRDSLCGGFGEDRLDGGPGRDVLNGGPDADVCIADPEDTEISC